jgi:hypothetical protein
MIPGCQLWLDGADPAGTGVIPANGATVSTWTDKSGFSNSPTSSSGTYPTYNSNMKCVSWPGTASQLTFPGSVANAVVGKAFTVFFVQQRTAGGADNFIIRGTAGAANQNLLIGYVNPATYYRFAFYANDLDAASGSYVSGEPATVSCFMYSKPNKTIYINGPLSPNASDSSSSDLSSWAGAMIGGSAGWAPYYGNVHEMIIYASSLNLASRQQVEGYLAQKWNLTSYIPTGHPALTAILTRPLTFNPLMISGCGLWLDASLETGSNASVVTTLTDRSGSGFSMTNSGTITLSTATLGGNTVYYFGSSLAYVSNFLWTTSFTQFVVVKGTGGWLSSLLLSGNYQAYVNLGNWNLMYVVTTVNSFGANDSVIAQGTTILTSTDGGSKDWVIFCLGYQSGATSASNYTLNGTVRTSGTGASSTGTIATNATLWINGTGGGAYDSSVYVAEMLHYNRSISTIERQSIEGYLAQKWGMASMLPVNHPGTKLTLYKTPSQIKPVSFFAPTQIAGCQLWLDSSDTSKFTFTSGSNINTWIDKSASGLTATYGGTPPVLTTFNGYNAIKFTGVNNFTTGTLSAGVLDSTGSTFFAVATITDTNAESLYSNAAAVIATASPERAIRFNGGNCLYTINNSVLRGFPNDYTSGIKCFVDTAASFYVYQNGSNVYSNVTAVTYSAQTTSTYFQIGNWGGSRFIGYLNEIIVFNRALPDAQRQQVETYLSQKWGLNSLLPTNHLVKSAVLSKSLAATVSPTVTYFKPTQITGCQLWLDASDATTITGLVTTAFTETFSNAGVPTSAFSGNGVANGTTYAYLVGNAAFSPYLTQANWTWSGTYSGISYSTSPFVGVNPTSPVSGSLGYAAFIQVNHYATPSIIYRTTTIPGGVSCTVSFWYCSRDSAASPLSISVTYGTQPVVTINKPIVANVWTNSTTTFITNATNQNMIFSVVSDTSNSYYSGDQTANIAYVQVTYTGIIDTIGFSLAAWQDKSSNAYNFNQLAPAAVGSGLSATYAVIGAPINGKRTLYFDPGASIYQSSVLDGVKNFFWVGRIVSGATNYFLFGSSSYYDWHAQTYPGKFCEISPYCESGIRNASPSSLYADDIYAVTNTSFSEISYPTPQKVSILSVAGITGSTRFQGLCYDRNAHTGWCGDLAEVITFSTALSTADRQRVESYLAQKWGLTSNLPSSHPGLSVTLAPFKSPKYIGGCSLWLDGADPAGTGVIPANGATVSTWVDKSGNGNNASTAAGTLTYSSRFKSILFNGSSYYTLPNGTISSGSANFTIFAVCRPTNIGGYSYVYFAGNGSAGQATALIFYPDGQIENGFWTDFMGIASAGSVAINNSYMFTSFYNGTRTLYRNGSSIVSGTPTVSKNTASANNCIGSINGSTIFYGTISELIVFNVALDTTTRQGIEAYLAQKWELTPNLSASHPGLSVTYSQSQKFALIGLNYYVDAGIATSYPGSGSTWYDMAGSGTNMTLYGSPTYSSANGGYISFVPSSSQYAQTSASLSSLGKWTVEVWHYYNNTNGGFGACLVTEVFANGVINFNLGNVNTNGYLSAGFYYGDWANTLTSYVIPSIGWYHIVGTYDGANVKLYLNGVLTQSQASSATASSSGGGIRFMGKWDYAEYWGGYLATVRIYATALTAGQIATNFNTSKSRFGFF